MKEILEEIGKFIDDHKFKIKILERDIARITQQGTTQAKFYIRKEKSKKTGKIQETYYLLHPMRNGKRRKEYVGRDPVNIRKAQLRMERFHERKWLISNLLVQQNKLEDIKSKIDEVKYIMK